MARIGVDRLEDIGIEVIRKLAQCNIMTVGQLCQWSRKNLHDLGIFSQTELDKIERSLAESHLTLAKSQ